MSDSSWLGDAMGAAGSWVSGAEDYLGGHTLGQIGSDISSGVSGAVNGVEKYANTHTLGQAAGDLGGLAMDAMSVVDPIGSAALSALGGGDSKMTDLKKAPTRAKAAAAGPAPGAFDLIGKGATPADLGIPKLGGGAKGGFDPRFIDAI